MASKRLNLYVIKPPAREGERAHWSRAGTGWVNRDGSIKVELDLFPGLDLQLREPPEQTEEQKAEKSARNDHNNRNDRNDRNDRNSNGGRR